MHPGEVAILVMAGGSSSRFGVDDKLLAEIDGHKLGFHAASRLNELGWGQKLVVAPSTLAEGFESLGYLVVNPVPGNGLGDNLALGAGALKDLLGVLVVLADMPFVTETFIRTLLDTAGSASSIVCTRTARKLMPPALIGRDYFGHLQALTGDQGAKSIFAQAEHNLSYIAAPADMTEDIDTPGDYRRVLAARQVSTRNPP